MTLKERKGKRLTIGILLLRIVPRPANLSTTHTISYFTLLPNLSLAPCHSRVQRVLKFVSQPHLAAHLVTKSEFLTILSVTSAIVAHLFAFRKKKNSDGSRLMRDPRHCEIGRTSGCIFRKAAIWDAFLLASR